MSTGVLRVYDPAECNAAGVPLDWERCRGCSGEGLRAKRGQSAAEFDEGCRHLDGTIRTPDGEVFDQATLPPAGRPLPPHLIAGPSVVVPVEASWRQVDVRTLGWPHDLRPEKLAVLCVRCWVRRRR